MKWKRSRLAGALAPATLSVVAIAIGPANGTPASVAASGGFVDDLDSFDSSRWQKADGWSNGGMFDAGWRADHLQFGNGVLSSTLDTASCPDGCSGKAYASGEYRSNDLLSYGRFEVRMKAVKRAGTVTSFFTYTGPSDGQAWDEIDVEILGKDPTKMQTNYFTDGVGGHETVIDLGFDASAGFHDFAIEWWNQGTINWFVDGRLVHQEDGSRGPLPTRPQRIMMNLWPGTGVDSWLEPFTNPGYPLTAQYDRVKYTPY